jgi:hypothetical protein
MKSNNTVKGDYFSMWAKAMSHYAVLNTCSTSVKYHGKMVKEMVKMIRNKTTIGKPSAI